MARINSALIDWGQLKEFLGNIHIWLAKEKEIGLGWALDELISAYIHLSLQGFVVDGSSKLQRQSGAIRDGGIMNEQAVIVLSFSGPAGVGDLNRAEKY